MKTIGEIINEPGAPGGIVRNYTPVRYDFGGFVEGVHPEVKLMHREAQWFVNDVVNKVRPRRWLSMLGASGVGKTHLAEAISTTIKAKATHLFTQCWKWQNIVSKLRNGDYGITDHLLSVVDVLILDDVGAENKSELVRSHLNRIADGRLGKWTVITSNLLPDDIGQQIDVRITSRLYRAGNVVCTVKEAPDYSYELYKRQHG